MPASSDTSAGARRRVPVLWGLVLAVLAANGILLAPYVRGWYPTSMDLHPLKSLWIDRSGAPTAPGRGVGE